DAPGELRLAETEQDRAHCGVDTVGADDERSTRQGAVLETHLGALGRLGYCDTCFVQRNRIGLERLHRARECGVEIAAMEHQMRRAKAPCGAFAELEPVPSLSGPPMTQLARRRHDLDLGQRLLEPERVENPRTVRSDLDAGAR